MNLLRKLGKGQHDEVGGAQHGSRRDRAREHHHLVAQHDRGPGRERVEHRCRAEALIPGQKLAHFAASLRQFHPVSSSRLRRSRRPRGSIPRMVLPDSRRPAAEEAEREAASPSFGTKRRHFLPRAAHRGNRPKPSRASPIRRRATKQAFRHRVFPSEGWSGKSAIIPSSTAGEGKFPTSDPLSTAERKACYQLSPLPAGEG